ncbi:MAG: MBL fold metallo-hydrolase [Rhizobiaceae bacterium]|jgi:phosphoribosyl 1,2-cyclic phosphate phosphodiesterase|nr:MBL fold metallo-hydrolase [Rhizobiaceae bacterium]
MALLRFTVLGCGSSPGVPRPNGDWGACDPDEPRNRRRRPALLVQRIEGNEVTTVVIDTGPDFREQMLSAGVTHIDGVVYTHAHADHIHGIDDLRTYVLAQRSRMPLYADQRTMERLRGSFSYIFEAQKGSGYPPIVDAHIVETGRDLTITGKGGPVTFTPFGVDHGTLRIKGYRIGRLGYCTDASGFPARTIPVITGLDVLVIDALQIEPHPTHFSLAQALDWAKRLNARRTILTHMHTPLDYRAVLTSTPPDVEPAFDGMVITLDA